MNDNAYVEVGVLIPCLNEAASIAVVVTEFRVALPSARIVVVDNGSTDGTAEAAMAAGADVLIERRRGKGYAVRCGLAALQPCEWVVLVDGDGTYSTQHAKDMIASGREGAGMVVGARLESAEARAFPVAHSLGNRAFILLVRILFGIKTRDLFSGYRVLSRDLVKEVALTSTGFEIEAELTLRSLAHGFQIAEIDTPYSARIVGSQSKLRTVYDGVRILREVLAYFRDYRPMLCFGILSMLLLALGVLAGSFPVREYLETRQVYRLPLAVLAVGLVLMSAVSAVAGLVLSSVARRARELRTQIGAIRDNQQNTR